MPKNKNALLLRTLSLTADAIGCKAAKGEFPVLLRSIAERRRVTSVEFCPLLVDAMLLTHPQGFRILFNSNGASPVKLKERYEDESQEKTMENRLRFSLAHELAHTLFYDLAEEPPKISKNFRSGGGKTSLENLERNCNKLAAHLLLPTPMLRTAFMKLKTIDSKSVANFANQAGVSIDALLIRLAENNSLFIERYFPGCIVLLKQTNEEILISSIVKNETVNIARDLQLMRSGERWQLTAHDGTPIYPLKLGAISFCTLTVETPHRTILERRYMISTLETARLDSTVFYLLTFEQLEAAK